jgi:3-oxosteroid 1-dehydrogenase
VPAEVDVIVLGSGAAGLTAAITAAEGGAEVAIFEKAEQVGGTSAWSGGHVWIPGNPHMEAVGARDDREQAITYIMSLSRGMLERSLIERYVDAGPEMVRFLDDRTPTSFYAVAHFPDYHPEHPGGLPDGGRTIECPLYPFDELGEWADRVTLSPYYPNPHIKMSETPLGQAVPQPIPREEMARRRVRDERGSGQALVGRLLRASLDRGIEPMVDHTARELILQDGRVTGVRFDAPEGPHEVQARRGVVLATGGFEWNEDYKRAFLRGPLTHPVSPPTNTGDGLYMAMRAGAMLGNMREAWWVPVVELPEGFNPPMHRAMVAGDRTRPRTIMVNRRGRRFTNEAANYNAFGGAFHQEDVAAFEYANLPCWLIFDQEYLRRYGVLNLHPPGEDAPDWITRGEDLHALAAELGIPGDELQRTVTRWNEHVAEGHDPDFHRGESAHDRWWGDAECKGQVQATLGPLDRGPYYALPVHSGGLGTKGGPRVDVDARVLDLDGDPIGGLYAAGNVMASPFGMTYGGAGGTLGPAMVFGYLAGRHLAAAGGA